MVSWNLVDAAIAVANVAEVFLATVSVRRRVVRVRPDVDGERRRRGDRALMASAWLERRSMTVVYAPRSR
jgi:hypothetical protein